MTMPKALHLKHNIDIYVSSKGGGRGLASFEYCVNTSIRRLEDYIKKSKLRTITRKQKMRRKTTV